MLLTIKHIKFIYMIIFLFETAFANMEKFKGKKKKKVELAEIFVSSFFLFLRGRKSS